MAAANEVSQLFSDLEQCEKSGNYIKGLKIANKSKRIVYVDFACFVSLYSVLFLLRKSVSDEVG